MPADHSGSSGIRATDTNRTDVSAALDQALADGQIDRFEHLERVRTATRATYVSELRPLLDDLQGVSIDLPGDGRHRGWRKSSSSSSSSSSGSSGAPDGDPDTRARRRRRLLLAIPVVTIALVGAVVLADRGDESGSSGSSPVAIEQVVPGDAEDTGGPVAPVGDDAAVVLDNPSPLTLEGLERMFSTALQASGSEVATRMTAHPEHGGMEWVDPEHPSRSWMSTFRGGWDAPHDRPTSREESFRIADLDAAMIAPIIAGAPETLRVPDGAPSHIIIEADAAGMPQYSVYASNDVHQSGYLTVNHVGEPVRMYPADR